MTANTSTVYVNNDFGSVDLLIELVVALLILLFGGTFAGLGIGYKRRQLLASVRDERADETVPTPAQADKQVGRQNQETEFLDCVGECAKNIIKGNVSLTLDQLSRLRRQKNNIRALALKKTSTKKKKRILQKGGLLGSILPPIISVLGNLLLGNAGC